MSEAPRPLILTLTLDEQAQAYFNDLRQRHFPPALNHLAAHVTLFHSLPAAELPAIKAELQQRCAALPLLPLQVSGVRFLGQGVAFNLDNTSLRTLHRELQAAWQPWLTPQDQHRLNPHVTVQNKVGPDVAKRLFLELSRAFQPFPATGTGLALWRYLGGPWEPVQQFAFAGS
ncbi:2'-5' RNA ligase family protein [Hymenobacter saemangeumensis]|uniref:2'-5' RNA ligase family protein n=1 Tax=Hymenobacter saemangeumensis TaxID=1084522 RepID=A0ABP8IP14_9BACT